MRKKILIITGMAVVAVAFAGCSASGSDNETGTTATTTATTTVSETTIVTETTSTETTTTETKDTETSADSGSLSKAETPKYNNDNPPEAYKEIITKHYHEMKNQCGDSPAASFPFAGDSHKCYSLSYSVNDLNEDGTPELMIISRNENDVFELYTLSGEEAVSLESGGYRASMWIDEDRDVCQYLSGGAATSIYIKSSLPKNATKLALVISASQNWGDCDKTIPAEGYDPVNAPDNTYTEVIAQEEFDKFSDRFYEMDRSFPFEAVPLKSFDPSEASDIKTEYANAAIKPERDPEDVWRNKYKVGVRFNNGIHIYLPSFSDSFYDGLEPMGNYGYSIIPDEYEYSPLVYSRYENGKVYYGEDRFEIDSNFVRIGVHEGVINIKGESGDTMPEDDGLHRYRKIGEKGGKVYYLDFTPPDYGNGETPQWYDGDETDPGYYAEYADMITESAWVE